jgi:Pretoxin HINT domain
MAAIVLMCAGLLGFSPPDLSEYQALSARAGKDVGAHVKLAVWCEAHGMGAERLKHLASALWIDPRNAAARGLMGLVAYGGLWLPPEKVGETVKADLALTAKLARYEEKRRATPETAAGQWELALWCEQQGLKAEATAHLTAVTRLDPRRTDAWHRLGCEFHHGRWLDAEQVAAERTEDAVQAKADRHWQPFIEKWKWELVADSPKRSLAISTLTSITDARAVPSIRRVFGHGKPAEQMLAVEMLGHINCPSSSHALAGIALSAKSRDIQQSAVEELKRRDPRDFVDALIGLLRRPLKIDATPVGDSNQPGVLIVEGETSRLKRIYKVPRSSVAPNPFGPGYIGTEPSGRTKLIGPHHLDQFLRESPMEQLRDIASYDQQAASFLQRAHSAAQSKLSKDLSALHRHNSKIYGTNQMVGSVLSQVTGESLSADPDAWNTWWNDRIGYRYYRSETPIKPTTVTYVQVRVKYASCFAAGTPVWTLTGPRPIESLQVGDLVLSQDTATGALGYEPIVDVHHNPPDTTLKIRVELETVVSTTLHRFWRPGRGWAMARDLKAGDIIRTLAGRTEVLAIEPGPDQPVFNLDVARTCTFFVGSQKELVHDNSLPPPVLTPFDVEPSLASVAGNPVP